MVTMETGLRHNENLMTVKEVSEYLRTSQSMIRARVLNKTIPFHKVGRLVRFRKEELDAWVQRQSEAA